VWFALVDAVPLNKIKTNMGFHCKMVGPRAFGKWFGRMSRAEELHFPALQPCINFAGITQYSSHSSTSRAACHRCFRRLQKILHACARISEEVMELHLLVQPPGETHPTSQKDVGQFHSELAPHYYLLKVFNRSYVQLASSPSLRMPIFRLQKNMPAALSNRDKKPPAAPSEERAMACSWVKTRLLSTSLHFSDFTTIKLPKLSIEKNLGGDPYFCPNISLPVINYSALRKLRGVSTLESRLSTLEKRNP